MTWFIDRRLNGKNKSTVNRQRFLRRYKAQIKQSISEAINKRSVTDVENGESVSIPNEDISEPMFHQGRGGLRHRVHPGNDHFVQNDRIERPQGGGGGGGSGQGEASADGEGQDEFVFQISKDEYLDLLFEDLALPNLKKNQQRQLNEFKTHRAGYTANGVPANISVVRSLQNSLARRTAMTAGKRRQLRELESAWTLSPKANRPSCWKKSVCVRKLPNCARKSNVSLLSTPSIYATKIMKNARSLQARR
jgi:uncharacterized sporulation protein YeaH/YhbH (DUF444 family)